MPEHELSAECDAMLSKREYCQCNLADTTIYHHLLAWNWTSFDWLEIQIERRCALQKVFIEKLS